MPHISLKMLCTCYESDQISFFGIIMVPCFCCSVEYWFRCMDLDGDGIISMYEMEYFYEEQVQKMEMLGIETLPFQDCLCQVILGLSLLSQKTEKSMKTVYSPNVIIY